MTPFLAYFISKGVLDVSLEFLALTEEDRHTRALSGTYLERGCVHACTQLYTRRYTVVYTRVYLTLLGSRYTLGKFTPRTQMLLYSV